MDNTKKIIFYAMNFVLSIVAISLFIMMFNVDDSTPEVSINNLSLLNGKLPYSLIEMLPSELYKSVVKNSESPLILSDINANIEDDSFTSNYNNVILVYYGGFVIKIEELNQSYYVSYSYSEDKKTNEQIGVPITVSLVGESPAYNSYEQLSLLLPYSGNFGDFYHFEVDKGKYFSPKNLSVDMTAYFCETNGYDLVATVNNLLDQNQIDRTLVKMNIEYICDGES